MNAAWAQMRRASTLAAYARMMAEAKKRQDEGKTENTEPKVEEAPKEEPKTEEPEIEEPKTKEPVVEESLTEEPVPVEESLQGDETIQDLPTDPNLSEEKAAE